MMRNRLLAILRLEAGMWVRALIRMAGRLARCSYTLGVYLVTKCEINQLRIDY